MSKTYTIPLEVAALSKLEAIQKAVPMLRDGVQVSYVESAVELAPGWWKVTLRVSEDT